MKYQTSFKNALVFILLIIAYKSYAIHPAPIETVTGARTKIVWARCIQGTPELDIVSPHYALWGYDSFFDSTFQILPGPATFSNPLIIPDGSQIIYSDIKSNSIFSVDWIGSKPTKICNGFALCVLKDPNSEKQWIYASDTAYGAHVFRFAIDNPLTKETVWKESQVSIRFRVSSDGKYAGGEFPWPHAGVADLVNKKFTEYGLGCNASLAPDTSLLFFHMTPTHREIILYGKDKQKKNEISLTGAPGVNGNKVWIPRWTNNLRFITMEGPRDNGTPHVLLGKFAGNFTGIVDWVQITNDSFPDLYPYGWIADRPQLRMLPEKKSIESDQISFIISGTDAHLSSISISTEDNWLQLIQKRKGNDIQLICKADLSLLPSGIHYGRVQLSSCKFSPEKYLVRFVKKGIPQAHSLSILPKIKSLYTYDSLQLFASVKDQFENTMKVEIDWVVNNGGTIRNGTFYSDGTVGTFYLIAQYNSLVDTAIIEVKEPVHPIAPILIHRPNSGGHYQIGDTLIIKWQVTTPDIRGVTISVSIDNGRSWHLLTTNEVVTPYDEDWGKWKWVIPSHLSSIRNGKADSIYIASNQCRIKISDYFSPQNEDISDDPFSIVGQQTFVTKTLPKQKWYLESEYSAFSVNGRKLQWKSPTNSKNLQTISNGILIFTLPEKRSSKLLIVK